MNIFKTRPPPKDVPLATARWELSRRSPANLRALAKARERSRASTSARLKRLNGYLGQRHRGP